jgi:hypothetical protein
MLRRNPDSDSCQISGPRVIRPCHEGFSAMIRSLAVGHGFGSRPARIASSRLTHAVAASLALGSLSLCLVVAFAALSIRIAAAAPLG